MNPLHQLLLLLMQNKAAQQQQAATVNAEGAPGVGAGLGQFQARAAQPQAQAQSDAQASGADQGVATGRAQGTIPPVVQQPGLIESLLGAPQFVPPPPAPRQGVVAPAGLTPEEMKILLARIEDKTGRAPHVVPAVPGGRANVGGVTGTLR